MIGNVSVWEETITMPTYLTSEPDKNPLFFERRVYQGSSGKIYPHPMTEKILDEKIDVDYPAVMLENDYLKVVILPTLGGRIQRAYDKTNDYDFVYYNQVIKPALVGLTGPWISGGIEFNWPQHHRPSTYMPTEYELVENADGSKTVWVSEQDKMYGTKGMAGFTLHPESAYIEITGKVSNPTDTPQTFLWWANPAVPANDHTVSIFPPDVHAVMDHGKRAVSDFPIATGTYYKYDYSEGVDISRYRNIKVPTSYMAHHSDYDFIGNYDEERQAGLLHVANHHVSPGKKQWVWGNSDFGLTWDRNLTDEDGPYVELMTGVFTDNQPDFTWLKPYEEKEFKQYFMPYKGVGRVKNATINGALNLEINNGRLEFAAYATAVQTDAVLEIVYQGKSLYKKNIDLSPANFYSDSLPAPASTINEAFKITLKTKNKRELVSYQGVSEELQALPEPAEALAKPAELKTTEELFLAATHIEQYRHASLEADAYYLEGLRRDSTDLRLNNGYGMLLFKQGRFSEAEQFLLQAVKKQTWKTPNPYYGEPMFNLGLVQEKLGKREASYTSFYKATWNEDTQGGAFYQLAKLEAQVGNYQEALDFVEKSLIKNKHNFLSRVLKCAIKRQLGESATDFLEKSLAIDPLNLGSHYERSALTDDSEWLRVMRGEVNNFLELSLDYLSWGLTEDALKILQHGPQEQPLIHYYQGFIYHQIGQEGQAKVAIQRAEKASSDYCFPNKLAEIPILELAIALLPEETGYARYYLGNLKYDKKQYAEAIVLWEASRQLLPSFPTVYRNLSFAYYNQHDDLAKAEQAIAHAFKLNPLDGRVLLEWDLLMSKRQAEVTERLDLLGKHLPVVSQRDDLYTTYITLLNSQGRHQDALDCLTAHQFHPWEGGEGKVSSQYAYSLIELGKSLITENPQQAITFFEASKTYPANLGEGKLPNELDTIADYYLGVAHRAMGMTDKANEAFQRATIGTTEPESVLYYYDQPADRILYQGLAFAALGDQHGSRRCFHQLIRYGEINLFKEIEYDYFAVSMPETVVFKRDLQRENQQYCHYLIGLGHLGLNNQVKANEKFQAILESEPEHQGALRHSQLLQANA